MIVGHIRQENCRPGPHRPRLWQHRLVSPLWEAIAYGCARCTLSTSAWNYALTVIFTTIK